VQQRKSTPSGTLAQPRALARSLSHARRSAPDHADAAKRTDSQRMQMYL